MTYIQILILAVLQGACELLPVSSSAHVIMAEKLMGIDPSAPEMTLLLVMLHTGTMFAVIVYFWRSWKESFFQSGRTLRGFAASACVATILTGVIGLLLIVLIEKVFMSRQPKAEVELLFGNLGLVSFALAAAGFLIIRAGWTKSGHRVSGTGKGRMQATPYPIPGRASAWIGAVQGFCIPFRGFSRSGATISTGLLLGLPKRDVEEFSFALVVIITPLAIAKEAHRLVAHHSEALRSLDMLHLFLPSLIGMGASFLAGLLALKWLSSWLERGRWKYFGYYCLAASAAAFMLYIFR